MRRPRPRRRRTPPERDAPLVSPEPGPLAVGERLRAARVKRGFPLAEAAERLTLPSKDLRALEWDRFDLLPSARYAGKCIRVYADFLGLDAEAYAAEHARRERAGEVQRARRVARLRRLGFGALLAVIPGGVIVAVAWYFGALG